jgi:hypothetical protein
MKSLRLLALATGLRSRRSLGGNGSELAWVADPGSSIVAISTGIQKRR